jgi:hypothetical protein
VRDPTLHALLEAYTAEASAVLAGAVADGEEVPFELVEADSARRGRRVPLYCYRPLARAFIAEHVGLLSALSSYAPAARALEELEGTDAYIASRDPLGESGLPLEGQERADEAMCCLLARVFEERSEFTFDSERFELAYAELEQAAYADECLAQVVAPMFGVALEAGTAEIELSDGLALVRGDALEDAPAEAVWGADAAGDTAEPSVLVVLRTTHARPCQPPVSEARRRFRKLLTALRLFDRGGFALGPLAWTRLDDGVWSRHPLGASGRPRLPILIAPQDADDLSSLYAQVARRMPVGASPGALNSEIPMADNSGYGELTWALSRFEMGCERLAPFEALTDYLLALRALLEPEGPASGRLAGRLAAICAAPDERAALAERTAHAISLERAVIAGLTPAHTGVDRLVEEIEDHLRAILRDVLCGHLDADVRAVADGLLAKAAVATGLV